MSKTCVKDAINAKLSEKNGKFYGEPRNYYKFSVICENSHIFEITSTALNSGKWCEECILDDHNDIKTLENKNNQFFKEFFKDYNFPYIENVEIKTNLYISFVVTIDDATIYVDISGDSVSNFDKISIITAQPNAKYIFVDKNNEDYDGLTDFFLSSIESEKNVLSYNETEIYSEQIQSQNFIKNNTFQEQDTNKNATVTENKIKILGYVRVSTEKQKGNDSVSAQKTMIRNYAKACNYDLVRIYLDEGISGGTLIKRPAIKALIDKLQPGYQVVTYSLSRLTRSADDAIKLRKLIQKKNATLILLDSMNVNTGNPALDNFTYGLQSLISNLEKDQVSARVSKVLNIKSANGTLRPKCKFGYRYVSKDKPFVKDEEEQNTIEKIRELAHTLEIPTVANIRKELEKGGYRTRSLAKGEYKTKKRKIKKEGDDSDDEGESYFKESNYGKGGWRNNQIAKIMQDNGIFLAKKTDFYSGVLPEEEEIFK